MIVNFDKYFIVKPVNGLANRLRVLLSYGIIANKLKIPYYVHWTPSVGFDNTNLFDIIKYPNFNLVTQTEWDTLRPCSFQIDKKIANTSEYKVSVSNQKKLFAKFLLDKKFSKITGELSNLPNWSFNTELLKVIPDHKTLYKEQIKKINVSDNIKNKSHTTLKMFCSNTLGVHIRLGDSCDERNPKHKLHNKTTFSEILEICKNHSGKIFISTDDKDSLNFFKENLKEKIIHTNKEFVDSRYGLQKQGQVDAMIDLYLLSKTKLMLPTSPSSFGKFASDLGGDLYNEFLSKKNYYNFHKYQDIIKW